MRNINSKPSTKSIFIWNIMATFWNCVLSVVTLMIATRFLTVEDTDIFSLGWSIAQLMQTIGTFQLRMYQVTDVNETFKFKQYLIFRFFTLFIMIICSIGYVIANGFSFYKSSVILIVCLFRAVESLEDVYEGYFQQRDRIDLMGKAITFRVMLSLMAFLFSLIVSGNLIVSLLCLLSVYFIGLFVFNLRYAYTCKELHIHEKWEKGRNWGIHMFKEGLPLFLNSFLLMWILNAPKIAIDSSISSGSLQSGVQTSYNILFMPASVLTLVYMVFRPLLTKMAIEWNNQNIKAFFKTILKIFLSLLPFSILTLIICYFIGIPVLSVLYGIDLSDFRIELMILVFGGCLCTFSYVFDNAIVVMRKQYMLLVSYISSWIVTELSVVFLVEKYGFLGATLTYALSMLCFLGVTFAIFLITAKNTNYRNSQYRGNNK